MTTYISPIFATGQAVDAALSKALTSVQEGDNRLTDSRNPLPHTHPTAPSTQLEYTATPAAGTLTLYPGNGTYQRADLPGDTTVVLVNPPAGEAGRLVLRYRVTGVSAAITWPANVRWLTTPVLATSGGTEGTVELEYGASGWTAKAYSPGQTDWDVIKALPQMVGYWSPAAGVMPSTGAGAVAAGGPVGFMTDLSEGLVAGGELNPDPGFDSSTGWTLAGGGSIAAGKFIAPATSGAAYRNVSLTGGVIYKIEYVVSSGALATHVTGLGIGLADPSGPMVTGVGTFVCYLRCASTGSYAFGLNTFGPMEVDSLSIKPVAGNHATQYTTANKPILRQTPNTKQYWLGADSTDALNITLAAQLTNAAVFRVTAEGVTVARTQTVATTYNLLKYYAYNGPIAIFDESSTALTTDQVAQITRYMQASVPSLGAELVPNGTFDTDTSGWSPSGSTLAVVNGELEITAPAGPSAQPGAAIATPAGVGTQIAFKVTSRRGTCIVPTGMYIHNTLNMTLTNSTSNVTVSGANTIAVNGYLQLMMNGASVGAGTAYFDDVSLKEIL